jgi:hypothetical protein
MGENPWKWPVAGIGEGYREEEREGYFYIISKYRLS